LAFHACDFTPKAFYLAVHAFHLAFQAVFEHLKPLFDRLKFRLYGFSYRRKKGFFSLSSTDGEGSPDG
jgi:hypothetical protein